MKNINDDFLELAVKELVYMIAEKIYPSEQHQYTNNAKAVLRLTLQRKDVQEMIMEKAKEEVEMLYNVHVDKTKLDKSNIIFDEYEYSLKELEDMKTIGVGQYDDLKIQTSKMRVWLSRMTVADGEKYNNKVTVERKKDGYWEKVREYQAK